MSSGPGKHFTPGQRFALSGRVDVLLGRVYTMHGAVLTDDGNTQVFIAPRVGLCLQGSKG